VTGIVTFDGEPIESGNIRFDPLDETPGFGAATKIAGGMFTIDRGNGLFAGTYLVAISATRSTGRTIAGEGLPGEAESIAEVVQFIPEHYNARSQLRAALAPSENRLELALMSAK
jgi:hypothetical protein